MRSALVGGSGRGRIMVGKASPFEKPHAIRGTRSLPLLTRRSSLLLVRMVRFLGFTAGQACFFAINEGAGLDIQVKLPRRGSERAGAARANGLAMGFNDNKLVPGCYDWLRWTSSHP